MRLTDADPTYNALQLNVDRARPPDLHGVSVGGILSPADAIERLEAGADLVQVYTGLVYSGPAPPSQIVNTNH